MTSVQIRVSTEEDGAYLKKWLEEPGILRWFPMFDLREIEDSIRIWLGYARYGASFTAIHEGNVVGMAVLYLQPFKKYAHHALFAIIVDQKYRKLGIGKALMEHFEKAAREQFHLDFLHLEVYEGNPAIRLYERQGFKEYGRHPCFLKEDGKYLCKILMQKDLSHGRT